MPESRDLPGKRRKNLQLSTCSVVFNTYCCWKDVESEYKAVWNQIKKFLHSLSSWIGWLFYIVQWCTMAKVVFQKAYELHFLEFLGLAFQIDLSLSPKLFSFPKFWSCSTFWSRWPFMTFMKVTCHSLSDGAAGLLCNADYCGSKLVAQIGIQHNPPGWHSNKIHWNDSMLSNKIAPEVLKEWWKDIST